MLRLSTLRCALRCMSLALPLANPHETLSRKAKPSSGFSTDTDTDTDAETTDVVYEEQLQLLEESLSELEAAVRSACRDDGSKNKHKDDATSLEELASECRSLCSRVSVFMQTTRGPKRIATSLNTWKTSRPPGTNPRQGFELRKLAERLQSLWSTVTVQVGTTLR